jgi:hypothetical protein
MTKADLEQRFLPDYLRLAATVQILVNIIHLKNSILKLMTFFGFHPGSWEFFSSPPCPERLWDPPNLLSNGYQGLFPWG